MQSTLLFLGWNIQRIKHPWHKVAVKRPELNCGEFADKDYDYEDSIIYILELNVLVKDQ